MVVRLLLHWILTAVSVVVIAKFLPGMRVATFSTALIVAAVYGVLHLLLFNILAIIAFIPRFLTFGLFDLVINAFLLFLTDKLIEDFKIDGVGITFVAAVLLTLLNVIWHWIV